MPSTVASPGPPPHPRLEAEELRARVRDGGALVLRVPALVGEGASCHPALISPFTTEGEGRLVPANPVSGVQGRAYPAGSPPPPPPPPPDPYRRIELELRVSGEQITLKEPRLVLRAGDGALVAACATSIDLAALPAYASVEACEAEAAAPLPWGECHPHLAAVAGDLAGVDDDVDLDARAARLDRILKRGGQVFALEPDEGRDACLPWRFTPGRRGGYGEMVRKITTGATTTRTEYAYEYDGATLLVLGPSTTVFEHGEEVSSMGMGCGDRLLVRHPDDRHAAVAGTPWFYRRADCLAARDRARPRGGC